MRTTKLFLLFSLALLAAACKNDPKPEASVEKNTPKRDTLPVYQTPATEGAVTYNITEGTVYWSAKKAIGNPHYGKVTVSGGKMRVNNGNLIGGDATMDMQSITVSDLKDTREKSDLEAHLKDTDFFDAARFPTGSFHFEEVLPSQDPNFNAIVRGDLTLKGKTNPVNIPAKITINGDQLTATTVTFPINRTQWGVNFRSGALGTAKDKLIEDVVTLTIALKAKKE